MFKTKILGRLWRIVSAPGMYERYGTYGDCDPPSSKGKAIRYDPGQTFWELMDTIGHECHHAAFPSTDHGDLATFHKDVARIQRRVAESIFTIEIRRKEAADEHDS